MSRYVFLYKDDSDDRDRIKYTELERNRFECGHYFTHIGTSGACFSSSLDLESIDFDTVTSILTKDEFQELDTFNKAISALKYGITEGDERYQKGMALWDSIQHILDKLDSKDNTDLYAQVVEQEKQELMDEYNLTEEDVDTIWETVDFTDKSVVGAVYANIEEAAEEEAASLGYEDAIKGIRYASIDYDQLGADMLEGDSYIELEDGRVVSIMR